MTKINSKEQYDSVMARIEELLPLVDEQTPTTDRNCIELELLSNLAADYEDEAFPIKKPSLQEILKLRLAEFGISQKEAAQKIGISTARMCDIINGKREPTLVTARKIATSFNIDSDIVLGII